MTITTVKQCLAVGRALRMGSKTGTPTWFEDLKNYGDRRRAEQKHFRASRRLLRQLPVDYLVQYGLSEGDAKRYAAAGFRDIWALSIASYETLVSIPNIGAKRLAKLGALLRANNVAVPWFVSAGK